MLSLAEIQQHLTQLTYKPGWDIYAYQGVYEYNHLVIRTPVIDTYNPDKTIMLDVHSMLPPMENTDQLEKWLLWRLQRIEIHEAREWFKFQGLVISDPHAEGADQDR